MYWLVHRISMETELRLFVAFPRISSTKFIQNSCAALLFSNKTGKKQIIFGASRISFQSHEYLYKRFSIQPLVLPISISMKFVYFASGHIKTMSNTFAFERVCVMNGKSIFSRQALGYCWCWFRFISLQHIRAQHTFILHKLHRRLQIQRST